MSVAVKVYTPCSKVLLRTCSAVSMRESLALGDAILMRAFELEVLVEINTPVTVTMTVTVTVVMIVTVTMTK